MILKSTRKSRDPSSFKRCRTSLVVEWARIRLLMHGTHVRSLVREDSTCRGATKPSSPQLLSLCAAATEAHVQRACAPQTREVTALRSSCTAMKSSPHLLQLEKAHAQQWRPSMVKINEYIKTVLKKRKWKQRELQILMWLLRTWAGNRVSSGSLTKGLFLPHSLGFSMVPLWQKAAPSEQMDPTEEKVLRSRWAKWEMVDRGEAAVSGSKSRPCWTNSGSPYLLRVWWQVYCILHGQAICF